MEKIAKEVYPELSLLKQVKGVGTQIVLTYALTIEDLHRFLKSREVGCFLGLRPGRRNSGKSEPQKSISKEGDRYLRTMMVQGAHYLLGPFGVGCSKAMDRRHSGETIAGPASQGLNLSLRNVATGEQMNVLDSHLVGTLPSAFAFTET